MLPRAHHQFCLAEAGQAAVFNEELITLEVVSRGLIDTTQFSELGTVLRVFSQGFLTRKSLKSLLISLEQQSWSHTKFGAVEIFILLSPIPTI